MVHVLAGHLKKATHTAQLRNVGRRDKVFKWVEVLFGQLGPGAIDLEAKKLGTGKTNARFVNIQSDIIFAADGEEGGEVLYQLHDVVVVSQPIVDVVGDVLQREAAAFPVGALRFRSTILLAKGQNGGLD